MVKSLGDFNRRKSSSTDANNIQWTHKKPTDIEKAKKKKTSKMFQKLSATNIRYTEKMVEKIERVFKIKEDTNIEKLQIEEAGKMFQKSGASNSSIQKGWKRKAR
jgi:hypothetical protein